jgi:hypothetical protein
VIGRPTINKAQFFSFSLIRFFF